MWCGWSEGLLLAHHLNQMLIHSSAVLRGLPAQRRAHPHELTEWLPFIKQAGHLSFVDDHLHGLLEQCLHHCMARLDEPGKKARRMISQRDPLASAAKAPPEAFDQFTGFCIFPP